MHKSGPPEVISNDKSVGSVEWDYLLCMSNIFWSASDWIRYLNIASFSLFLQLQQPNFFLDTLPNDFVITDSLDLVLFRPLSSGRNSPFN